jgi:MFS family permease
MSTGTGILPNTRSQSALDWLNFFLADVQTGVGPFLAIYLTATRHWNPAQVGTAMAVQGIATVVAQSPAGALVDATTKKRGLLATGVVLVAMGSIAIVHVSGVASVLASLAVLGLAGAVLPITVAAITLGVVTQKCLPARIGRNEAFNHAGNVAFALVAGVIGTYISQTFIFYAFALVSIATLGCISAIRPGEIDHEAARGGERQVDSRTSRQANWRDLLENRHILTFASAVVLFHFANAAMLPLVGELLSRDHPQQSSFFMSACILLAQAVMVPVAMVTGRLANTWGRKGPFLIGFAVLALRGVLYTMGHQAAYLLAVQSLDGIGAAIFGVLWVIVVADLAQGTGHFNVLQGTIQACLGVGAFLSNFVAGLVVKHYGFNMGFLVLAAVAAIGFVVYLLFMPETKAGEAKVKLQKSGTASALVPD